MDAILNIEKSNNTNINISIYEWNILKSKIIELENEKNKIKNYLIINKLINLSNLIKIKKQKKLENNLEYNEKKKFSELTTKLQIYELLKLNFDLNTNFKLKDVYIICENILSYHHPNNNTIKNTIRRNLQSLRDDGYLIFVNDSGTYYLKN